jgi:hypothetical protein
MPQASFEAPWALRAIYRACAFIGLDHARAFRTG